MSSNDEGLPHFTNSDGKKIVCRYWTPKETPSALVFICHGAGEHSGCYNHVAEVLSGRGFKAFSHDHVGHGLSEGIRVHLESFDEYTRDVIQHVQQVKSQHPQTDCFIIGHSLGGCIALKLVIENPELFKGILLVAPAVILSTSWTLNLQIYAARMVGYMFPQFRPFSVKPEYISKDKSIVSKYENDPLVHHGSLTVKFLLELLDAMAFTSTAMDRIQLPLWCIHGTDDKLAHVSGSTLIQEKVSSTDKTVKIVEGAYHQIHNEPDGVGSQCIKDMCDWISARL